MKIFSETEYAYVYFSELKKALVFSVKQRKVQFVGIPNMIYVRIRILVTRDLTGYKKVLATAPQSSCAVILMRYTTSRHFRTEVLFLDRTKYFSRFLKNF